MSDFGVWALEGLKCLERNALVSSVFGFSEAVACEKASCLRTKRGNRGSSSGIVSLFGCLLARAIIARQQKVRL